jgi:hypothetical protein
MKIDQYTKRYNEIIKNINEGFLSGNLKYKEDKKLHNDDIQKIKSSNSITDNLTKFKTRSIKILANNSKDLYTTVNLMSKIIYKEAKETAKLIKKSQININNSEPQVESYIVGDVENCLVDFQKEIKQAIDNLKKKLVDYK